jgi:hypothetical protein
MGLLSTFCEIFREEGEEVRAAYLMVKSSTEEELTSVQQFMEALQFAGKFFEQVYFFRFFWGPTPRKVCVEVTKEQEQRKGIALNNNK